MILTADDLALIKSTATSKFETELQATPDQTYRLFTVQDTFGAEGYVPTILGGMGPAQEWLTTRVLHSVGEFGVRFVGKVYANGIQVKKEALRISPVATSTKYSAMVASDAQGHSHTKIVELLNSTTGGVGFDKAPLFGDHKFSDAVDAPVYTNYIAGNGSRWLLLNDMSYVEATAEDYALQVYGGDNTAVDFMEDSLAMGWRAVKIYAPGFWANSLASEAELTSANLRTAINTMAQFKNDKGQRIGAKPKYLVVSPANAAAAEKLIKAQLVDGGNSNIDYGRLTLVVLDDLND